MINLEWIISEENKLTDKAKFNLGDNYMLLVDLLELSQGIKSFSKSNEVSHFFESQIIRDFHLSALNIIRRHSIDANILIRHAIESLVLFTFSFENKSEEDYSIKTDTIGIVDYDKGILKKANEFFEQKFPISSEYLEGFKATINSFYSHSNIYSSQFNIAIIDGRLKSLLFDHYLDDYARDSLCVLNDIIVTTLDIYILLEKEYKSFTFIDRFEKKFEEHKRRHFKNFADFTNRKNSEDQIEYPEVTKIKKNLKLKYEKIKHKKERST